MSWERLRSTVLENQKMAQEEAKRLEQSLLCPICGYLMEKNTRGTKNCPFGHYRSF